ncbi:MAG: hypothetical protein J2P54_13545 [Bradyrhizobiaceae bacterium]|nr:hypothetical protein [Bradyrhizobiaceae bacterium]
MHPFARAIAGIVVKVRCCGLALAASMLTLSVIAALAQSALKDGQVTKSRPIGSSKSLAGRKGA